MNIHDPYAVDIRISNAYEEPIWPLVALLLALLVLAIWLRAYESPVFWIAMVGSFLIGMARR